MESGKRKPIKTFQDLEIYQNLYRAMITVLTKIIPSLPKEEKFDLVDQMRRCCKAGPALIAEGFAKRYQKKNWEKYINDTLGECNEMIHHLSICIDIYFNHIDTSKCKETISTYNICCRQLTNLKKVWKNYHEEK
ncbi:four helix bundle protein [Candidatus Microgenomates bacterium]|nr:MAG: four helix bundle protein [Candidatus Microgenomates bacterium]